MAREIKGAFKTSAKNLECFPRGVGLTRFMFWCTLMPIVCGGSRVGVSKCRILSHQKKDPTADPGARNGTVWHTGEKISRRHAISGPCGGRERGVRICPLLAAQKKMVPGPFLAPRVEAAVAPS